MPDESNPDKSQLDILSNMQYNLILDFIRSLRYYLSVDRIAYLISNDKFLIEKKKKSGKRVSTPPSQNCKYFKAAKGNHDFCKYGLSSESLFMRFSGFFHF